MYRYADSRAKCIDLQMKSDCVCKGRVLYDSAFSVSLALHFNACALHNTDNMDEIKTSDSSIILDLEGVVGVG